MTIIPRAWLPFAILIFSYTATTAAGALSFLFPDGLAALKSLVGDALQPVKGSIGTPTYLALLLLPYVLTTAGAAGGIFATRALLRRVALPAVLRNPPSRTSVVIAITMVAIAYCAWTLAHADVLPLSERGDYQRAILFRVRLFSDLGFFFFALLFGAIPVLTALLLVQYWAEGHKAALVAFLAAIVSFHVLLVYTEVKSHVLVLYLMLLVAAILCRRGLGSLLLICLVAALCFALVEGLQHGRFRFLTSPHISAQTERQQLPNETQRLPDPRERASQDASTLVRLGRLGLFHARNLMLRMSSAMPFYVSIFSNPEERCGLQAHTVRRVLGLPPARCVVTDKVHNAMWPSMHWVQGQVPAAAHITAYAEIGMVWALIAMVLSGLAVGILGAVIEAGEGPIFVGFGIASSAFAYYLTQLPFIAPFTYHHGLIFFTAPVLLIAVVSLLLGRGARIPKMAAATDK